MTEPTNQQPRIVVIDDDPTGSQTVHSCLLLMQWDVRTIRDALLDEAPLFFLLTNSRGMDEESAQSVNREVARNLRAAAERVGEPPLLVVSRSDSTLRGHFPAETDVLTEELGPFDVTFMVPAFFEAGRVTIEGVHYIRSEEGLLRTDQTPFAKDSLFGYSSSYLPKYVEEKSGGRVSAREVVVLPRDVSLQELVARIDALPRGCYCAVDAEQQRDLDRFADAVRRLASKGRRYLFRSAASLLTSLSDLPPQPISAGEFSSFAHGTLPGVVICGSHVPLSTQQLESLLREGFVRGVEIDVDRAAREPLFYLEEIWENVSSTLEAGRVPVVYTSRDERSFDSAADRIAFGEQISEFLVSIVRRLPEHIGFLIAKGGITSHEVLARGLELRTARVLGQIAPGVTVVLPPAANRLAGVPTVIFPGNVGAPEELTMVTKLLLGTR
ncbi:MAG: four-carbon acid sugar kinase family protein [Spirochaetaceae bacterium]